MSKTNNIITSATKAQILAELKEPGCSVRKLARAYNVSTTTIYNLKRRAQEIGAVSKFVELAVRDQDKDQPNSLPSCSLPSSLQKASLIFDDFSLALEGSLRCSTLLAIIKILEEQE